MEFPATMSGRFEVAYFPERFSFYSYYTVENTVAFFGKMRGIPPADSKKLVQQCLEKLDISDLKKPASKTSPKDSCKKWDYPVC